MKKETLGDIKRIKELIDIEREEIAHIDFSWEVREDLTESERTKRGTGLSWRSV